MPTERVFDTVKVTGATAYDIPGAEPFSHDGELCSFDLFLRVYGIAIRKRSNTAPSCNNSSVRLLFRTTMRLADFARGSG